MQSRSLRGPLAVIVIAGLLAAGLGPAFGAVPLAGPPTGFSRVVPLSSPSEVTTIPPKVPVFTPHSIPLGAPGSEPLATFNDYSTLTEYVEDSPAVVIVISTVTDQRIATLTIGNSTVAAIPPTTLADDPVHDELWVLGPGILGISAIDLRTDTVARSVELAPSCQAIEALAWDPVDASVWVVCQASLIGYSPTTNSVLFDLNLTYPTGGITYDPAVRQMVVAIVYGPNLTNYGLRGFNASTAQLAETVLTGTNVTGAAPLGGLTDDPNDGTLLFAAQFPGPKWGIAVLSDSTFTGLRSAVVPGHPEAIALGNRSSSIAYLSLYGSGSVASFNLSRFTETQVVPVDGTPAPIDFDPVNGAVDVADIDTGQLVVLDGGTFARRAVIPIGGAPSALAYDPRTDSIWTANSNNLSVVSDRTHRVVATVPIAFGPTAIAINATSDRAYVATYDNSNVTVLNASNYGALAQIAVDPVPIAMLLDPSTGVVFVACLNGTHGMVDAIDPGTDRVVARLPVGNTPSALAIDPGSGTIVVTNQFSDNLSLISPSTLRIVGAVNLSSEGWAGFYPAGIAVDPADGELFLSDAVLAIDISNGHLSSELLALRSSNFSVVGNVTIDPVSLGVAYDPGDHLVLAASYWVDHIDVVDPTTLTWNATIAVGGLPIPVLWDPATNETYVGNSLTANLTYLPPPHGPYTVTFEESGLGNSSWSVTINGTTATAVAGAAIVFGLPNGTFSFLLPAVPGYSASPGSGVLLVEGKNLTRAISFVRVANGSTNPPSVGHGPTLFGLPIAEVYAGAAAAAAGILIGALIASTRWPPRHQSSPTPPAPPSPSGSTPVGEGPGPLKDGR